MKLFKAIATGIYISIASMIAPPYVEASVWRRAGENSNGDVFYVKPLQFSGRYRYYLQTSSHKSKIYEVQGDCAEWRLRLVGDPNWQWISAGSIGNAVLRIVC